jgi:hypothetical protein
LAGKPERKRLLGRHRRRWEDNIAMHLREIGCGSVDWMHLIRNKEELRAVVKTVMNILFHKRQEISSLTKGIVNL